MKIMTLKPGEAAPADSDCISVDRRADGKYTLTGSVLSGEQSVAMVGGPEYDTPDQAREEGIAWAAENGVATLYVATSGA